MEFASGDRRDAEDAICGMDGRNFGGRDITVCFSREVRKHFVCHLLHALARG